MTVELEKTSAQPVRPGAQPLAPAGATYLGAALAVLVVAAGAVGIREALVEAGVVAGDGWVAAAVSAVDGAAPASWMPAAGIVVAVVGLTLMLVALKPRRRRTVRARAATAVYVDLTDVARIARAAAEAVPGVLSAPTTASRRTLTIRCEVSGASDADLENAVIRSATDELAALERAPRIRVRLTERT